MSTISRNTKLKDVRFCAVDLETTGTNPFLHRIIEVGMTSFSLNKDYEQFQTFCDPGVQIPESNTAIHGITDDMVAGSPSFCDVKNDVFSFMKGSVLIGHNPVFDLAFLTAGALGSDVMYFEAFDTVRLARMAFPESPNHKLGTLCGYLGIESNYHRALADAVACMKVFGLIIEKMDPAGECTLGTLLSLHGGLVPSPISERKANRTGGFRNMKIGKQIKIVYRDFEGVVSERCIVPQKFIYYGKREYVLAHCLLSNAERIFNAGRIMSVL